MKKIIFGLAISSLLTLGAVSCGQPGDNCPICPEPEKVVETVEVLKKFDVTTEASKGAKLEIVSGVTENKFEAGDEIKIKVTLEPSYRLDSVLANKTNLTLNEDGTATFVAPKSNLTIKVTATQLTTEDLTKVTKLAADFVAPSDAATFKETLETALTKDEKYLVSATIDSAYLGGTTYGKTFYNGSIRVGHNNSLKFAGSKSTGSAFTTYDLTRATQNGHYLEHTEGINKDTLEEKIKVKNITTQEIPEKHEITDLESKKLTTSFLSEGFFKKQYIDASWLKNTDVKFETTISEDRETFTTTASLKSGTAINTFKVTLDGDLFLRSADYANTVYDSKCFDETGALIAGSAYKTNDVLTYTAVRGYRTKTVNTPNINDYAYQDYNVLVNNKIDKVDTKNSGTIYFGERGTFKFELLSDNKAIIEPYFIGFKETNAIDLVSFGTGYSGFWVEAKAEGTVTALFDNGTGSIKEVPLTLKQPAPTKIFANFDSEKVLVGSENILRVSVTPNKASAEATVTLKQGSAKCTITPSTKAGEEGIYYVTPEEAGTVTLVVTSTKNAELTKEVSFEALPKPTYDAVYNTLTTKTLKKTVSIEGTYKINFNADGTGVGTFKGLYGSSVDKTTFNWTIDKTTLDIVLTNVVTDGYDKLTDVRAISSETFSVDYEYNGSVTTHELSAVARETL